MKIVDGEPGLLAKIILTILDYFQSPVEPTQEEIDEYKELMRKKGFTFEGDKEK